MFVLDTDVVSRTSPLSRGSDDIAGWLMRHRGLGYLSVVSLVELRFGVDRLRTRGSSRKAAVLGAWLVVTEATYEDRLLITDSGVAHRTGEMLVRAETCGFRPGLADACIAATAELNGYEVVTFNTRHFAAFGVPHRAPDKDDARP